MQHYDHLTLDEERSLYGVRQALVSHCTFDGPADGESALKECSELTLEDSYFALRYPLWHLHKGEVRRCTLTEGCRAALWYDEDTTLEDCALQGIKAVRECDRTALRRCRIASEEFGWFCRGMEIQSCRLESEYPFLKSRDMEIRELTMKGKYSFQYTENVRIEHSVLDTKDAFWHSRNVTVLDSVVRGEYLGWYSENLRLVRCKIIGTQPLCYAKGLVLEDCEMEGADLSFERSAVQATIRGGVLSVKNPLSGSITADSIGDVILDTPSACRISVRPAPAAL